MDMNNYVPIEPHTIRVIKVEVCCKGDVIYYELISTTFYSELKYSTLTAEQRKTQIKERLKKQGFNVDILDVNLYFFLKTF